MFDPKDLNNKNDTVILSTRSTSGAILEIPNRKISEKGVSTNSVFTATKLIGQQEDSQPHWYALRATYGQEKKAYEYILSKKGVAFYPTVKECRLINNKRVFEEISMLPNMLFAYGTEEEIKSFVYDNVHLPFLRFYYSHHHEGNTIIQKPTIIPEYQMNDLKILCSLNSSEVIVTHDKIKKFEIGQTVKVIEGKFEGMIGIVSRYKGQQRVGLVINGMITVATAYVPSAFIEKISFK